MNLVLVDSESEIRKSEALVKSRYKLKPLALKLITTLISGVQNTDSSDKVYSITVKQFTTMSELKGNDYYHKLDEATTDIMRNPLFIPKEGKGFIKANWCSSIEYVENEAIINFEISSKIFPYILDVKERYLKYDLTNILLLKSDYSIRMYEWLKDEYNKHKRYGKTAEVVYEIDYLRDRFEIPKSYQWNDVKRRILSKAQTDLLANCDIKFDWEVATKLGKKTSHVKFKIYPNSKNIKTSQKLPAYLGGYMSFVKHLRAKYGGTGKYFMLMQFDVQESKGAYYFGINNENLVYAMSLKGGESIRMSKNEAEVAMNAAYLGATHSDIYRDIINDTTDFWEFSRDTDAKEFYGVVAKEISSVLNKYDPRNSALF